MSLQLEPAVCLSLRDLADLLNRSFAEYFVPVSFTPASFATGLRLNGQDLNFSQVVMKEGRGVGLALLSRRGWTSRLAAMAILPGERNAGIGQWLMGRLVEQARQRGDRYLTLEVIEENAPAVHLYKRAGFTIDRRLVGYRCEEPVGNPSNRIEEVDVREVAQVLLKFGPPDLPWQLSGETIAQLGPPVRGHRWRDAFGVIEKGDQGIKLLSLVVLPHSRRSGQASSFLQGLFAHYPNQPWKIAAQFPEEIAPGLFEKLGFVQDSIRQYQMTLALG